jgi:hypothetical protein
LRPRGRPSVRHCSPAPVPRYRGRPISWTVR